jgi:hypothetical protein
MKSEAGSMNSKVSTLSEKDSATTLTERTTKQSKSGSSQRGNSDTKQEGNVELIDDCFYVKAHSWGTVQSYDAEGNGLITSLTEETCIAATRWYLKARQDGFTEVATTYDGSVGGKL